MACVQGVAGAAGQGSERCLRDLGRLGLAAKVAANPSVVRGRSQTSMDLAERLWTQPAVLLATRNA